MTSKASVLAFVEMTRQRLGFTRDRRDKGFVPTQNVRIPQMLGEADAFSEHLRDFAKAVRDYHRHVQGFLHSLPALLDSNLPRVWAPVAGSLAEPVRPAISHGHPSRVGGDYDVTLLLKHLDRLERGIEEEVLAPLRRWQEGLAVAKERTKSLEKLRKEVDTQRRKAEKKFRRTEHKLTRAYLGAGYGESTSSSSDEDNIVPKGKLLEDYQRLALHTERQLRAILESYEDQERLVWEQLCGLVTDAAWLESYAAAAMLKVKEAMQGVALALGASKQPLPAYRGAGAPSVARYGEIGGNQPLIQQMSPRALELASGASPRGVSVLPYTPLHASRGLATPLLVAAAAPPGTSRQRQLALEPVPPVQLGASAVPLQQLPENIKTAALRQVEQQAAGEGIRVRDAGGSSAATPLSPASAQAATPFNYSAAAAAASPVEAGTHVSRVSVETRPAVRGTTPARAAAAEEPVQAVARPIRAAAGGDGLEEQQGPRAAAETEGIKGSGVPKTGPEAAAAAAGQQEEGGILGRAAGAEVARDKSAGANQETTGRALGGPPGTASRGTYITDVIKAELAGSARASPHKPAPGGSAAPRTVGQIGNAAGGVGVDDTGAYDSADEFYDTRSQASQSSSISSMGFEPTLAPTSIGGRGTNDAAALPPVFTRDVGGNVAGAPWSPDKPPSKLPVGKQEQQSHRLW
eukprot:GHRR01000231.1.p1 GENE.GHRR01000231.1~~GHRR01000231.1.p1  ORF type:complete len:691 (+),score=298.64 GHRR01000231.1:288-2360(+)